MENLSKYQKEFATNVAQLILFINDAGYEVTFGDAWANSEDGRHKKNSLHYSRLAIDLNLFDDKGKWLKKTEDHERFRKHWESMHEWNRWGGRYSDGNHYEMVPHAWRKDDGTD